MINIFHFVKLLQSIKHQKIVVVALTQLCKLNQYKEDTKTQNIPDIQQKKENKLGLSCAKLRTSLV